MPVKNEAATIHYRAYNASTGAPVTGDAANHTLRYQADAGTPAAPAASPAEADATYLAGVYRVTLALGENTGRMMALGGSSSTANVKIIPTFWSNETQAATLATAAITSIWSIATATIQALASTTWGRYIASKLGYIVSSTSLQSVPMVSSGELVEIIQGNAYAYAKGLPVIRIEIDGTTIDLTGQTPKIVFTKNVGTSGTASLQVSGTVHDGGLDTQHVTFDLSATDSAALAVDDASAADYPDRASTLRAYTWRATACADKTPLGWGYASVTAPSAMPTGCS